MYNCHSRNQFGTGSESQQCHPELVSGSVKSKKQNNKQIPKQVRNDKKETFRNSKLLCLKEKIDIKNLFAALRGFIREAGGQRRNKDGYFFKKAFFGF